MSTRCFIAKANADGTFDGIYCHHDGYISYVGSVLEHTYRDEEKVDKLLDLGDLSVLGEYTDPIYKDEIHTFDDSQDKVCIAYGRDRGEENVDKKHFKDYAEMLEYADNVWCEFLYVFCKDKETLERVKKLETKNLSLFDTLKEVADYKEYKWLYRMI